MDSQNTPEKEKFICGVVEGFYGKPWTTAQRKDLFAKMKKWGMNSYLYGPKDDYKHRACWRELYTVDEADNLSSLISTAKENGIRFIYAISPGLTIAYSSSDDVAALKRKLEQVSQLGCDAFAILFDDIPPELSKTDKEHFQSFAHAQASVTNQVYEHLNAQAFMFCPTEYCASRAVPSVHTSEYLNTIGSKLNPKIDIMWTGPIVVSKEISIEGIEELAQVIRRPPLIWDNLHANDYDQRRILLGPYSGRSTRLISHLRGVLTNPNCEYGANFVGIHTLAQWSRCSEDAKEEVGMCRKKAMNRDEKLKTENEGPGQIPDNLPSHVYHPRVALRKAVKEWLEEFKIYKPASDVTKKSPKMSCPDKNEKKAKPTVKSTEELTVEDLHFICDLFYLPFGHGDQSLHLLRQFQWLKSNSSRVIGISEADKSTPVVAEWYERAAKFAELTSKIREISKKLDNSPNRELVYELQPYLCEVRGQAHFLNSYVKWLGSSKSWNKPYMSGDQEPWVINGGLAGELQRLIPVDRRDLDLHLFKTPNAPTMQMYTIRPYCATTDKTAVYKVCTMTFKDGLSAADEFANFPELPGDIAIGEYIDLDPEVCFVIEDSTQMIVGVALAVLNAGEFRARAQVNRVDVLRKKYSAASESDHELVKDAIASLKMDVSEIPALVLETHPVELKLRVVSVLVDPSVTKRLVNCVFAALRAKGLSGCFIEVCKNENSRNDMYKTLGFNELCPNILGQRF